MRARLSVLVVAVAAGCNTPTYLSERRPLETMADGQGGFAADTDLYVLPVRRPTSDERAALQKEQQQRNLPQAVPWVGTRDFAVQIQYSIKNLDNQTVTAFFSANGGNQYADYVPANFIDPTQNPEDQTPPPPLLGGSPLVLGPLETRLGVFREDQIREGSIDLEAITRYPSADGAMATPFIVIEHDSSASALGLDAVPPKDVTPLWVRYQLNLAADGHVVCDYNVRVRSIGDPDDKLAPGGRNLYVSTAATLP